MKRIFLTLMFLGCTFFPGAVQAQSSGSTPPPPPYCTSSNSGAIYTNTGTTPPTVYTCSYYNLAWQWVVNPSYGGLVYYPTVPSTCSGSLPAFLAGWPNTIMYVCANGVPEPISFTSSTVTGVTASLPLSSSGGLTPKISETQAGASTAGWLSSTDWNTFNGKQAALGYTPLNPANNLSDVDSTATARGNLSAAASGANSDITSLSGLATPLSSAQGGTGTSTPPTAGQVPTGQANGTYLPKSASSSAGVGCPTLSSLGFVEDGSTDESTKLWNLWNSSQTASSPFGDCYTVDARPSGQGLNISTLAALPYSGTSYITQVPHRLLGVTSTGAGEENTPTPGASTVIVGSNGITTYGNGLLTLEHLVIKSSAANAVELTTTNTELNLNDVFFLGYGTQSGDTSSVDSIQLGTSDASSGLTCSNSTTLTPAEYCAYGSTFHNLTFANGTRRAGWFRSAANGTQWSDIRVWDTSGDNTIPYQVNANFGYDATSISVSTCANISSPMYVFDYTTPSNIPPGTTITSCTYPTVVINKATTGVASNDTLYIANYLAAFDFTGWSPSANQFANVWCEATYYPFCIQYGNSNPSNEWSGFTGWDPKSATSSYPNTLAYVHYKVPASGGLTNNNTITGAVFYGTPQTGQSVAVDGSSDGFLNQVGSTFQGNVTFAGENNVHTPRVVPSNTDAANQDSYCLASNDIRAEGTFALTAGYTSASLVLSWFGTPYGTSNSGMTIKDLTTPGNIPSGTQVYSYSGGTLVMTGSGATNNATADLLEFVVSGCNKYILYGPRIQLVALAGDSTTPYISLNNTTNGGGITTLSDQTLNTTVGAMHFTAPSSSASTNFYEFTNGTPQFPYIEAASGQHYCLQIDGSGNITNVGSACASTSTTTQINGGGPGSYSFTGSVSCTGLLCNFPGTGPQLGSGRLENGLITTSGSGYFCCGGGGYSHDGASASETNASSSLQTMWESTSGTSAGNLAGFDDHNISIYYPARYPTVLIPIAFNSSSDYASGTSARIRVALAVMAGGGCSPATIMASDAPTCDLIGIRYSNTASDPGWECEVDNNGTDSVVPLLNGTTNAAPTASYATYASISPTSGGIVCTVTINGTAYTGTNSASIVNGAYGPLFLNASAASTAVHIYVQGINGYDNSF